MQIKDSCSIANSIVDLASLNNLNKFADIDINLTDTVNLINFALKAISLVIEDRLRINDLFLIKPVTIRS